MNSVYAMQRANGDWFALDQSEGFRVPIFSSNREAMQARAFNLEMLVFKPVLVDERALENLESSKAITDPEWGSRVATELIPKWQAAEDQISATQLPADSRLAPLRGALLEYLDQKRRALRLFSEAVRDNDPAKAESARRLADENSARAAKLRALIQQVY